MIANIDRRVRGSDDRRILECKTARDPREWGQAGTTDVPGYIMAQAQHYIHVLSLDQLDIACLFGGRDFRIYPIMPLAEMAALLIEAEEEFFDRVEAGVPPEITYEHRSVTALIKLLYPGTNGSVVTLPAVAQQYVDVLDDARKQRLIYEKVEQGCKNRLSMLIGEASAGLLPGGNCFTRKLVKRSAHEVQSTEYIDMRHQKTLPKALVEAMETGDSSG